MDSSQIRHLPIGVFDSGFGGITVLAKLMQCIPHERYIYYADSKYAPYGVRSAEEIRYRTEKAVEFLLNKGIKALVVACNTATSVAINEIRNHLNIPVIGMEPALKPAVEQKDAGAVVVMATPVTLAENKFRCLIEKVGDRKDIIPLPCPGLVEIIENGHVEGPVLQDYLKTLFGGLDRDRVDSIVLGCTHYIYVKKQIKVWFNNKTKIVDGNYGTAKHLMNILQQEELLLPISNTISTLAATKVQFYSSGDRSIIIPVCWQMLDRALSIENYC